MTIKQEIESINAQSKKIRKIATEIREMGPIEEQVCNSDPTDIDQYVLELSYRRDRQMAQFVATGSSAGIV